MFEKATRLKLRFSSPQGLLSVEDLWDLPLTSKRTNVANLDDIARGINHELEQTNVSFVPSKNQAGNSLTKLKLDLVVHIINTKVAETEAQEKVVENKQKKDQILALIAQKETETLAATGIEELRKLAASL